MHRRPHESEYDDYYGTYIGHVPDGDIVDSLARQADSTHAFLTDVPEDREQHRYREGAWSVREVMGHLIDAERVFASRALWFAREAPGALPGMDQNAFARTAGAETRSLSDLAEEFRDLRRSHVHFFRGLPAEAWERTGIASDVRFTVRSLAWILAGHELHHVSILRDRYGLS